MRAYRDQRVAWLWEDGWTLVRATTERERDRLLGRFAGDPSSGLRNFLREPVVSLFQFDVLGHRRALVSVDAERKLRIHLHFAYNAGREKREIRNGEHVLSLARDLEAEISFPNPTDSFACTYWPGHCPDPDSEGEILLGNLPRLFTCPTTELS